MIETFKALKNIAGGSTPPPNLPSSGSVPANIAGAPSHFTVILTELLLAPASISLSDLKKFSAALPPSTPKLIISSSRCSRCKFFPALLSNKMIQMQTFDLVF